MRSVPSSHRGEQRECDQEHDDAANDAQDAANRVALRSLDAGQRNDLGRRAWESGIVAGQSGHGDVP